MKKLRACTSNFDDDGPASSSSGLPPDILFEVLTRVSAKSLIRFKSVSKLFSSVISNPQFVEAHRARSTTRSGGGGLLISIPVADRSEQHYFFASDGDRSLSHQRILPLPESGDEDAVTEVIDGLVCFYAYGRVSVCNVFTGEIRSLPVSSFHGEELEEDDDIGTIPHYYFGFDPVKEEYKVLNVCTRRGSGRAVVPKCKILTLGKDSSWRRLAAAPPLVLHRQSVCVNGVLHWMAEDTACDDGDLQYPNDDNAEDTAHAFPFFVVAFDLDQETFRLLPPVGGLTRDHYVLQVEGKLAVSSTVACLFGRVLGIWTFAEHGLGAWVKDRTRLPRFVWELGCFAAAGALPNGEVLLTSSKLLPSHPSACIKPIFSWDRRRNEWHRLVIADQFPPTIFGISYQQARVCISYHLENIIPLRDLVPDL